MKQPQKRGPPVNGTTRFSTLQPPEDLARILDALEKGTGKKGGLSNREEIRSIIHRVAKKTEQHALVVFDFLKEHLVLVLDLVGRRKWDFDKARSIVLLKACEDKTALEPARFLERPLGTPPSPSIQTTEKMLKTQRSTSSGAPAPVAVTQTSTIAIPTFVTPKTQPLPVSQPISRSYGPWRIRRMAMLLPYERQAFSILESGFTAVLGSAQDYRCAVPADSDAFAASQVGQNFDGTRTDWVNAMSRFVDAGLLSVIPQTGNGGEYVAYRALCNFGEITVVAIEKRIQQSEGRFLHKGLLAIAAETDESLQAEGINAVLLYHIKQSVPLGFGGISSASGTLFFMALMESVEKGIDASHWGMIKIFEEKRLLLVAIPGLATVDFLDEPVVTETGVSSKITTIVPAPAPVAPPAPILNPIPQLPIFESLESKMVQVDADIRLLSKDAALQMIEVKKTEIKFLEDYVQEIELEEERIRLAAIADKRAKLQQNLLEARAEEARWSAEAEAARIQLENARTEAERLALELAEL